MQQLTQPQLSAFAASGIWRDWNDEQIVRFQLFQGLLAMDFDRFHDAMEGVLSRRVSINEYIDKQGLIEEYLSTRPTPTLEEIIELIPADKRIILNAF